MSQKNLISVLFPVYNTEKYLEESLFSLLTQTHKNIEVIAVNDGSSDNSLQLLNEIAAKDNRVRVIDQNNKGLVKTLNYAASIAKGQYIARMDSDDLSLPHRFEEQIKVLEANPEVILVAGTFEVIDDDGEFIYREIVPAEDDDIKRAMYARNPIAHGSVMFRKDAFNKVGGYSEHCGPTEDYELWSRMASHGKFAGIEGTVFRWRVNPKGITRTKEALVEKHMLKNLDTYWKSNPPAILKRTELRRRGKHYLKYYKKHGVFMKLKITSDNAQLAVKLLRRKHFGAGLLQLLHVASTGRSGLRLTFERIALISSNLIRHRGFEKKADMLVVDPNAKAKDQSL